MARRNRTEPQPTPNPTTEPTPTPTPVAEPRRPILLAGAALLFAGWVGWLAFLVATARPPVVLSHPQMLAATLDVVAQVDDLEKPVKVVEVLGPDNAAGAAMVGQELTLGNLGYCAADWIGPGRYLLPLRKAEQGDSWVIAPTAPSPGFPPLDEHRDRKRVGPPRIYPDTPSVREQRAQLRR